MPDDPQKFKLLLRFGLFMLPPTILVVVVWLLSLYTPFFHSLGQILLVFVVIIPLLYLSGKMILGFIRDNYEIPLSKVDRVLHAILSKTFKPLPEGEDLKGFRPIYLMIFQLQSALNQDQNNIAGLQQIDQAQLKLFETAISETTDPIIVLDSKLLVKYINQAVTNITGLKKIDAIGVRIDQFIRLYDKSNAEILPQVFAPINRDNPSLKIYSQSEVKIISNINKQSYANVSVLQPPSGQVIDVGCVLLLQDKTKEKQLEAMKLDFVSMAAHELRTPLTSIKGYISVFISENKDKLTPDQMMFVTRINTSTQQLAGLVENLLSVARVERGAMNLHTQVVNWVDNVKAQVDTFMHRAEEKRISLKFLQPSKNIPQVNVDLVRINEVLNNMIANALNYTEPMGKIEVSIDTDGDMVCTHIKDTGKGISKENLQRLFEKFFRVQGGPAEQASKGNGLGLYLSKAIVELHKGKVYAESEGEGKGSTFTFCLPAADNNLNQASFDVLTKTI